MIFKTIIMTELFMAPIFWPEATSQTSICLFFAFLANFLSGSRTLSLTLSSLSRSLTPLSRLQIKDLRRKDVDAVDFNDPLVEEKSFSVSRSWKKFQDEMFQLPLGCQT